MLESANTEGQRYQRRVLSAEGVLFFVFQRGSLPQCVIQRPPPGGLGERGKWQRAFIPGLCFFLGFSSGGPWPEEKQTVKMN